jgi:two-component system cell cycle sensor histidine kinase/response regulator CckA
MVMPRSGPAPVILVVDDDAAVLQAMARALLLGGFAVHTAMSGPDALALVEDLRSPVDLVVTDIRMEPMDGMALAAELLARDKASRFLFVTGFGTSAEYDPSYGPLLPKPFTPDRLVEAVTHLLF